MASRLPAILNRLSNLLEGKISGLDRSIPARRFEHVKFPVEYALPKAASKPYPFHIAGLSPVRPDAIEENVAGVDVYRGLQFTIRIGYATNPHDEFVQQKAILEDAYQIHYCLSDPDSWGTTAGFSAFSCSEAVIAESEGIPGSQNTDEIELMLVLEIPCELVYREDYS